MISQHGERVLAANEKLNIGGEMSRVTLVYGDFLCNDQNVFGTGGILCARPGGAAQQARLTQPRFGRRPPLNRAGLRCGVVSGPPSYLSPEPML